VLWNFYHFLFTHEEEEEAGFEGGQDEKGSRPPWEPAQPSWRKKHREGYGRPLQSQQEGEHESEETIRFLLSFLRAQGLQCAVQGITGREGVTGRRDDHAALHN